MVTLTSKFCALKCSYTIAPCTTIFKRNYMESIVQEKVEKKIHPYRHIHPWKSLTEFSTDLLNNVIYNKDGLVALNKPYGIVNDGMNKLHYTNAKNLVPNCVDYTLKEALPHIARHLNYESLTIVRSPATYMSGVALLAANERVQNAIRVSIIRSKHFSNTYWVLTIGVPKEVTGQHRLAIKSIWNREVNQKKLILATSWSKNDEKNHRVKLLKTDYQVLSNSMLNLCSLVQIKSSTARKHALRLFASTFLYCPILGDDSPSASLIQKVGDTYLKVDPFIANHVPPKLDKRILKLLNVSEQNLIPLHIHLRSVVLPEFFGETLKIEAPLWQYFDWTCKQLEFKYVTQKKGSSK